MTGYDSIARHTFVGIGTKIGGGLGAAGIESTTGILFNAFNPSWNRMFTIENVRLQIGIGGGIGLVVVLVFNCQSFDALDGTKVSDWGVNFTLGPSWTGIARNLGRMGFFGNISNIKQILKSAKTADELKNAAVYGKMAISDLEGIKNGVNYFWNANDIAKRGNAPTIAALDVPGASIGAEISICPVIQGQITLI